LTLDLVIFQRLFVLEALTTLATTQFLRLHTVDLLWLVSASVIANSRVPAPVAGRRSKSEHFLRSDFRSVTSFAPSPAVILLAVGFSALIGMVFGFFPALRGARLDPIDALRHE